MGREMGPGVGRATTNSATSSAWNDVHATTKGWPSMADAAVIPGPPARIEDVPFDGTEGVADASGRRNAQLHPSFPLLHPTCSASNRGDEALHLPSSSPRRAAAQGRLLPRPGSDRIVRLHETIVGFVVSTPWTVLPVLSGFVSVRIGR